MDNRDKLYFFNKMLLSSVPVLLLCNPTIWVNQINTLKAKHSEKLRAVTTGFQKRLKHKQKINEDI